MSTQKQMIICLVGLMVACVAYSSYAQTPKIPDGIWISKKRISQLPISGPAWEHLFREAEKPLGFPDLSDQDSPVNVHVLAKALVYARLHIEKYRQQVIDACMMAIGTERRGRTLALGRELAAYVVAADLVKLPEKEDRIFREWLNSVRYERLKDGRTLIETHEQRPNNWGTHAGATRVAIDLYLGDLKDLARAAMVFKGYLGDRKAYAGFRYKQLWWQADPLHPVGINPKGATKEGHSVDGVLPDDQRRAGPFRWPPPKTNYVYTALQGALVQAVFLSRAGYDVWNWEDKALLRAFKWLYEVDHFPAVGDDTWLPHLVNYYYDTNFPAPIPARAGKNMGWTDWTHAKRKIE